MTRNSQLIETRYDALMFAKTPEAAREAAKELVRTVLGEEAMARPLTDTLRECCRILRPAPEGKDQARFEEEFIELAFWPGKPAQIAA
jgi:hypothetical protein